MRGRRYKMKYTRKTYDKFFIESRCGFDGSPLLLPFNFSTERECDKKLTELNTHREKSLRNLMLNPFGWMSSYRKVKKRIVIV
jgi:hypothetical protein